MLMLLQIDTYEIAFGGWQFGMACHKMMEKAMYSVKTYTIIYRTLGYFSSTITVTLQQELAFQRICYLRWFITVHAILPYRLHSSSHADIIYTSQIYFHITSVDITVNVL